MTDEIMAEVRRIRDGYVAAHGHSLNAVYEDIKKREAASKRTLVDLASLRKRRAHGQGAEPDAPDAR